MLQDIDTCILVQRLTDVALYGGTHRARFDRAGRGVGLTGRREPMDIPWILQMSPEGLMPMTPTPMLIPKR